METNSQYLRWFHELERELWSFFGLFGDLCGRLRLYDGPADFARQIEDMLPLPDILPILYGSSKKMNVVVSLKDVEGYRHSVRALHDRMKDLALLVRNAAIQDELPPDMISMP